MSRTIRRKGWHVTTSSKWHEQKNNPFYYVKACHDVEKGIEDNLKEPERLEALMKERHRDGFWKTLRWHRYASPVPRLFHKAEIKRSLKYNKDYNWNEKAARQYEKGLCQMLWD